MTRRVQGGILACLLAGACTEPPRPEIAWTGGGEARARSVLPALEGCAGSLAAIPGDLIRHRPLRREDFRARSPAQAFLSESGGRGAQVGLTIACRADLRVEEQRGGGFAAQIHGLRYFALLDRERSWWNDEAVHVSAEWTLRHEQLHFDLAEIEARRLNAAAEATMQRTQGRGATGAQAVADLQRRWRQHMLEVRERLSRLELRYDRETRHGLDLTQQTEWFLRSKRALQSSPGPPDPAGGSPNEAADVPTVPPMSRP